MIWSELLLKDILGYLKRPEVMYLCCAVLRGQRYDVSRRELHVEKLYVKIN